MRRLIDRPLPLPFLFDLRMCFSFSITMTKDVSGASDFSPSALFPGPVSVHFALPASTQENSVVNAPERSS
jgi:hypothetical protein